MTLIIVQDGRTAAYVRRHVNAESCKVRGVGSAMMGLGFDEIIIACQLTTPHELLWYDTSVRTRLNPEGTIVNAK